MVFKKSCPGPHHAHVEVHNSSRKSSALTSALWMDALQSVGEYVDSPRERAIEEPAVKKA